MAEVQKLIDIIDNNEFFSFVAVSPCFKDYNKMDYRLLTDSRNIKIFSERPHMGEWRGRSWERRSGGII